MRYAVTNQLGCTCGSGLVATDLAEPLIVHIRGMIGEEATASFTVRSARRFAPRNNIDIHDVGSKATLVKHRCPC